jgi:ATP-dependent 26S proteasome regulatory subunit
MSKEFEDGSGFADFLTKRMSKKSTVGIVETPDKLRKEEYLNKFKSILVEYQKTQMVDGSTEERPVRLFTVDLFSGINQVLVDIEGFDGSDVDLENMKITTRYVPYGRDDDDDDNEPQPCVPFIASLPIVSSLIKDPEFKTIIVISGLINDQQTLNTLEMFVDNVAINGDLFRNQSMVCIITPSMGFIPASVLNNSFHIRPLPSTRDERKRLMDEIIEYHKLIYERQFPDTNPPTLTDKPARYYIDVTDGLNKNDFQSALMETYIRNNYKKIRFNDVVQMKTDIVNSMKGVRIDNLDKAIGFDAVGGYDPLKMYLNNKIVKVYSNYELAQKLGVHIPRGVLLFGPPGTGKTHIARQLSKGLDCVFIEILFDQLLSKYVGESEDRLNDLLNRIDMMGEKVVVFFDEIDSLGKRSGGGGDGGSQVKSNMFGTLLKWMGDPDRQAVVIGATNTPEHLDPAFIREGRFDKMVYMGLPDVDARKQIFEIKFKDTGMKIDSNININKLAENTKWYSGARIEGIVKEAHTIAFERIVDNNLKDYTIMAQDMEKAMEVKKKSVESIKQMDKSYQKFAEEFCDDKNLIMTVEKSGKGTKPVDESVSTRFQ